MHEMLDAFPTEARWALQSPRIAAARTRLTLGLIASQRPERCTALLVRPAGAATPVDTKVRPAYVEIRRPQSLSDVRGAARHGRT